MTIHDIAYLDGVCVRAWDGILIIDVETWPGELVVELEVATCPKGRCGQVQHRATWLYPWEGCDPILALRIDFDPAADQCECDAERIASSPEATA